MFIIGAEYAVTGQEPLSRGVLKQKVIYQVAGICPTPLQKEVMDHIDRGLTGDWEGRDPYNEFRRAEVLGIEIHVEELLSDGKWHYPPENDAILTLGHGGAL